MTDFEFDCLERKRLARNARYRKIGSKSKRCPMSTDYMTPKQWKERCGKIMSIKMNEPADWMAFKQVSPAIQREYLLSLIEEYRASATDLAKMFGVCPATLKRHLVEAGVDIPFTKGRSMTKEMRAGWEKFLAGNHEEPSESTEEPAETIQEEPNPEIPRPSPMVMSGFTLYFEGEIDPFAIANSLLGIIGSGANGCVTLTYTKNT